MILQASGTDRSYFYHYDGAGNVTQLTDGAQNTVADYAYDAYGNSLKAVGAKAGQPYRFSTKEYQSASGLYDYGFRFYNPSVGRWLTRDPLREGGGLNLYAAFGNSPTNLIDGYGLCLTGGQMLSILALGLLTVVLFPEVAPVLLLLGGASLGLLGGATNAYNAGTSYSALGAVGDMATGGMLAVTGGQVATGITSALALLKNSQCFVAGTKTLDADGKPIAVEKVKKGMWVSSRDPKTKKLVRGKVTNVSVRTTASTLWLSIGDASGKFIEKIGTTSEHPFYVEGKGFVPAKSLGIGTSIVTRAGPSVRVLDVETKQGVVKVYNFTVDGTHSYFVGQSQLWVHNIDCNLIDVWRGVAVGHEKYDDALDGRAVPLGGDSTPMMHSDGFTDSPYTSWSTDRNIAETYAKQNGPGGVLLHTRISPPGMTRGLEYEREVLVRGPVEYADSEVLEDGF